MRNEPRQGRNDVSEGFAEATGPLRRELLVHCYRMLGSADEAEDLVQETLLRAWRSWERYDSQRASLRTWLYAIATNVCLSALDSRRRRPLPSGLGPPATDPDAPLTPRFDIPWLQPLPDERQPESLAADPQLLAQHRADLRLALVAALQALPPRQRAVLILRDVLRFTAAEVAEQLDSSVAGVNSALQRARSTLDARGLHEDEVDSPDSPEVRALVERYARAFEEADVPGLVALLTEAVVLEMPPVPLWYTGRADYGRFMSRVFALRGTDWRMLPTWANGQPALAAYCADGPVLTDRPDRVYRLHTVQVFTISPAGVHRNVVFQDSAVFRLFALPATVTNVGRTTLHGPDSAGQGATYS